MISKQLLYYRSKLDEVLQPLPVGMTDDGTAPKPLILDVSPGAIRNLGGCLDACGKFAQILVDAGESAIIARPCGGGPGSVYQGPAEVDFFEAVDFICQNFAVDRDRICVMGGSMGGAATWYLASHYPDFFAAAAPFCGYCDYRLWVKPGGTILRTQEWEHPSWQARGAAYRVGNLSNTTLRIVHGEWDTSIGGGVPVQHSRNMSKSLRQLGIAHTYTEVPECGHGCMQDDILAEVLPWLCRQQRRTSPHSVDLTVHTLRHNRSHWLRIDALEQYGGPGRARGTILDGVICVSELENVAALTVGPVPDVGALSVTIGGTAVGEADISVENSFRKDGGQWCPGPDVQGDGAEKKHGCSGPIGDLFFEPVRIVLGTQGGPEENFVLRWLAGQWVNQFKQRNGGVHRGVFDGESDYEMKVVEDTAITDRELETCNLILAGTQESNAVARRISDDLPVAFGNGTLSLQGKEYAGEEAGACVLARSPFNPERYVVVNGGVTPRSAAGSSHFGLQLLPDYLVWDREKVLSWGFFDGGWG